MIETKSLRSPNGHETTLFVRNDTSDMAVVFSTFGAGNDEYQIGRRSISGWAIDIGAHIGTVGLAILADHPYSKVIFVEPLKENCVLISDSVIANGWTDRAIVVHGAIAEGTEKIVAHGYATTTYGHSNRFIGGLAEQTALEDHLTETVQAYSFGQIAAMADGPIAFVKWDCEGCEWLGLTDPAVQGIGEMVGEYHSGPEQAGLHELLDATHDLAFRDVMGSNGLFEAVRR